MRLIMALADRANAYIEAAAPWNLAKEPDKADRLKDVCTVGLNLFRQLAVYLAPVLPRLAVQTGELLGLPIQDWDESQKPVLGSPVAQFKHMMKRVEARQVEAMIAASQENAMDERPAPDDAHHDGPEPLEQEPLAEECSIDDFAKVDLRVARVIAADDVAGARKLVRLTLSLGGDVRKTVFAGIKEAYRPSQLVGRLVVCVANLAPRRMKFGTSEGMVVAVGPGGKDVFLVGVDEKGAVPGQRVH
jgi:methionyl-tRNA synthetase